MPNFESHYLKANKILTECKILVCDFCDLSPELPMQRRRSPENASLRSDGIQPHSYCLTECLLALPCDKSCPGTVVTTALGLEQLELAKGVPVILAVTSPF